MYSAHAEALKHIYIYTRRDEFHTRLKHTRARRRNREQTNTQRVLQGVIIGGELLLIFHMRISENLHGTRRQKDSATYIFRRVTV